MPSLDCKGAAPNTPLKCIYWNVRSISGKKNVKHLQHYINKRKVDLLFLSETWQRRGQQLPELQGYRLFSCMSDQTGGRGGVACYFKHEYASYVSCYKSDPEGHYLWLKLDQALGFEHDLFAAVCYFPPAKSTAYKGRDRLEPNFPYTRLHHDIFAFSTKKSSCDFFVVGDFNSRIGDAQAPEAHRHGLARESADKKINKFGMPLMDICDKNDLLICNGVTQVWPKSGETTCRSKSVIDYLLAPVSRARYLVKDIQILPLEKKSDHNAMNFTLRRPRPLREILEPQEATAPSQPSQSSAAPSAPCPTSELLHRPLSEPAAAAATSSKAPTVEPAPEAAAANKLGCETTSPKNVIMSSDDDGAEASSATRTPRSLSESGATFFRLPAWERYERRFAEQELNGEVALAQTDISVARPYSPPAAGGMNAAAWFEAKTSRTLNKILADGMSQQDRRRKPSAMDSHPLFSLFRKGYMTRNLDALTKQQNPKCSTNNNKLDMGTLGSKEYWNRKVEEVSLQEPVFLQDKRELMTINSRPASVASPGLVHIARLYVRADTSCRGQSSDGSRMTTSGSWGAKGLKMGPGYRCTCMCPGHHHSREVPPPHPFFKSDTFTRTLTVVESSKLSTLLKSLKSAYDSGKLWSSITQFKITRKIAKAIR